MDNPTNKEQIEIIARALAKIIKRLDNIENVTLRNDEILTMLKDIFEPPRELVASEEQLVLFTKELYKQICEYCGEESMQFMAIA